MAAEPLPARRDAALPAGRRMAFALDRARGGHGGCRLSITFRPRRSPMLIVDSQVHTWAADTPERPWSGGGEPHRAAAFTNDDLLREMDAAGVDRAVLVPPGWEGSRNDLALAAARAHPDRFAVMGRIRHDLLSKSQGALIGWRRQPGMLGLRLAFNTPKAGGILSSGKLDWLWREAEAEGVPLMILIWHEAVHYIDAIAARHPQLRIVMDHLSLKGDTRGDEAFRDFDKLLAIAQRPNVAAKASALPCYSDDTYPYRSLHKYVRQAYDAFGPKRLFWGTDLSRSPIPYRQQVTMFTEEMPFFTSDDLAWIMGRGVCEWLGWP
jgi:predicted TIM-barrel fold metal-dependent hydrolase